MAGSRTGGIPHYYLYGDDQQDVELDLLHVEPIRDRSGPNDWRIRPHAHPDHMQVLLVCEGQGSVRFEDRQVPVPAPAVMCIPAGIVHQIDFAPGTDGFVVTAALGCLQTASAQDTRLAQAAGQAAVYPLAASGLPLPAILDTFEALHREFIWSAPGRRAAMVALFMRILVTILRLSVTAQGQTGGMPDRDYDLVLRYRALLEDHFRTERGLGFYAGALAVTPARLNAACKARADRTASELLHDRLITEAKRYLIYTESSVAQVAHMTGFDDPAYFNRFFAQRVGLSPGAFRKRAEAG